MDKRIIKLPGVRACALHDLLQALIDEIGRRSGPHRPLVYSLTARKATSPFVHPGVDLHDCQLYLMYAYPPSPTRTLGQVVLAIPACTAGGCGPSCCNKCEGELAISVWRDPTFPFTLEEVYCFIAEYFHLTDLAWANIEDDVWRSLRAFFRAIGSVPAADQGAAPGLAPAQGKPGAPWLDCNLWLLANLEQLPDPVANTHLEGEYLRRHFDETGIDLAVPHRDFQKAAARCIKVIKRRGRGGSNIP
jgi:hypothetical protein